MLASVVTRASVGIDAPKVVVEVHASNGLPGFSVVGLPEASVRESKDRVRSALLSCGFQLPPKRITVNLAPADLPKSGGRYDLAIALGILVATEQLRVSLDDYEFLGELSLNGEIREVPGVLPSVIRAQEAASCLVIPAGNLKEASLAIKPAEVFDEPAAEAGKVLVANHLLQLCRFLMDQDTLIEAKTQLFDQPFYDVDLSDVRGQAQAKRVLELSASGGHSLLMVGPPGSGKSMLAQRLVTLLPELNREQAMELATIHSVAGKRIDLENGIRRQIVSPHHTASSAALVGGGSVPKPGAISLAHHGVLFLDELPEFSRNVLEALREPLETRRVEISRVSQQASYPANFLLVAAMNPTPSGYFPDDPHGRCKDSPDQIARYQRKVSGPLLDRIDLHLEIPPVDFDSLQTNVSSTHEETSEQIRERVTRLHDMQRRRQGCLNSELTSVQIKEHIEIDQQGSQLLKNAIEKMGISARSYHRILRIARTLADMEGNDDVKVPHLAEAIGYRSFDRNGIN
ncbi:YifB family Mg chelatase-like AAA ATPase [Thiomicrorhabdus sp. zzn3]|uniref:YifB family Mg chelatase-like AAA ATPase n=1 Tax=Thiomicrorhabdus sp. zzn3 TaxID=3039775 RepID=UPI002436D849|nr:YifB family Mg chelatase-like AAA ATPase [Thiomicrorhabdus sp. zzn3]MDG6778953.1 YifB family Mg chelatase-like AAA ATPase [Thiomicrorhabdus sp. zzn3]